MAKAAVDGLKALMRLAALSKAPATQWLDIDGEVERERANKRASKRKLKKGKSKYKSPFIRSTPYVSKQTPSTSVVPITIAAAICCWYFSSDGDAQLLGVTERKDSEKEQRNDKGSTNSLRHKSSSRVMSSSRLFKRSSKRLIPRCFSSVVSKVSVDVPEEPKPKGNERRSNRLTFPNYKRVLLQISNSKSSSGGDISDMLYSAAQTFVPKGMEYRDITKVTKKSPRKPTPPPAPIQPRPSRQILGLGTVLQPHEDMKTCERYDTNCSLPTLKMSLVSTLDADTCCTETSAPLKLKTVRFRNFSTGSVGTSEGDFVSEVDNSSVVVDSNCNIVFDGTISKDNSSLAPVCNDAPDLTDFDDFSESDLIRNESQLQSHHRHLIDLSVKEQFINSNQSAVERNREIAELMSSLSGGTHDVTSLVNFNNFKPNFSLGAQIQNVITNELEGKVIQVRSPHQHHLVSRSKQRIY